MTLLAGLSVAVVLFALSMAAPPVAPAAKAASATPGSTTSAPAATGSSAATDPAAADTNPSPIATEKIAARSVRLTFAGHASSGSIAVSVRDDIAIAYICDGNRLEAWLKGTVSGDQVTLTGKKGARIDATISGTTLSGSGTAGGRKVTFKVSSVKKPSGLYRGAASVRGATIIGGWIVLADGTQVGVVSTNEVPAPAPPIDPSSGKVTVAGTPIIASSIDPDTGSHF